MIPWRQLRGEVMVIMIGKEVQCEECNKSYKLSEENLTSICDECLAKKLLRTKSDF